MRDDDVVGAIARGKQVGGRVGQDAVGGEHGGEGRRGVLVAAGDLLLEDQGFIGGAALHAKA